MAAPGAGCARPGPPSGAGEWVGRVWCLTWHGAPRRPFSNGLLFDSMAPESGIMLASFLKVLQQHVFNHDACNVEALTARIKALGRGDPGKLVLWKELIVVSTSPCSGGVLSS